MKLKFVSINKLYGILQLYLFVYVLSAAPYLLQQQSCSEPIWSKMLKIFTIRLFTEKVCWLLVYSSSRFKLFREDAQCAIILPFPCSAFSCFSVYRGGGRRGTISSPPSPMSCLRILGTSCFFLSGAQCCLSSIPYPLLRSRLHVLSH